MGFFHLSVGSYGLLPMKSVQKDHGIIVTLQLNENISLCASHVHLYFSVDFQKWLIVLELYQPFQRERKEGL